MIKLPILPDLNKIIDSIIKFIEENMMSGYWVIFLAIIIIVFLIGLFFRV